jgi:predicted permease
MALALVGGVVGVGLAVWGTTAIANLPSTGLPRLDQTGIDLPVLGFTLLVSLVTGVVFGLLPAWQAGRTPEVSRTLKEESGTVSAERERGRTRRALVTAELALALVLLAGAGLLVRSFLQLVQADLGMEPRGVLTFQVSLPEAAYDDPARRTAFVDQLMERLNALPGVQSTGAVFPGLPLAGFGYVMSSAELDGRRLESEEQDRLSVHVRVVTPDYFRTLGVAVRQGRVITPEDREGSPPAMVVNESAARLIWPDADPIGHRLSVGTGFGLGRGRAGGEVVGVVADLKDRGPAADVRPMIFLSLAQWPLEFLGVAIRTGGDPNALAAPASAVVAALDPDVPVYRVGTMEQLAADAVAQPRLYAGLLGFFAIVATVLAAIGVYGVVARAVQQRRREVGIRMALGARPAEVRRQLVRQGLAPVLTGVALGLAGGFLLTRLLRGLLFEVTAWDPVAFAGAVLLLVGVATLATYLPAWRATRADPMVVLRYE